MGAYVILVYILSFGVSFSLGANGGANVLAPSYGSGAANIWLLLIGGALFEFIGAYFMSGQVAAKVVMKMLPTIYEEEPFPSIQDRLMFSMSFGSCIFVMCVTFLGMPISCTHTMIGGLLGAGVFGLGWG
jgi:inorganic phosphate transporter, PiT family